jgi:phage tail-like protein
MPNPALESVTPPFTTFRFEVTLNLDDPPSGITNPVCNAAFAECDGLEMTMEPKSYSQGGDNARQVHRAGPVTYSRLTLRRGMTSNLQLWSWLAYAAQPGHNARAQGQVTMLSSDGEPAVTFTLQDCLPIRMRAPSLNAKDGQVGIEELQLVYGALAVRLPGDAGTGIGISAGVSVGISASASVSGGPGLSASFDVGF